MEGPPKNFLISPFTAISRFKRESKREEKGGFQPINAGSHKNSTRPSNKYKRTRVFLPPPSPYKENCIPPPVFRSFDLNEPPGGPRGEGRHRRGRGRRQPAPSSSRRGGGVGGPRRGRPQPKLLPQLLPQPAEVVLVVVVVIILFLFLLFVVTLLASALLALLA